VGGDVHVGNDASTEDGLALQGGGVHSKSRSGTEKKGGNPKHR